jgi:hypothetical protein
VLCLGYADRLALGLPVLRRGFEPGVGLTVASQRFQNGVINDYITWLVTGVAAIGAVLALIVR